MPSVELVAQAPPQETCCRAWVTTTSVRQLESAKKYTAPQETRASEAATDMAWRTEVGVDIYRPPSSDNDGLAGQPGRSMRMSGKRYSSVLQVLSADYYPF